MPVVRRFRFGQSADWLLLPSKGPITRARSRSRNIAVAAGGPFFDTVTRS